MRKMRRKCIRVRVFPGFPIIRFPGFPQILRTTVAKCLISYREAVPSHTFAQSASATASFEFAWFQNFSDFAARYWSMPTDNCLERIQCRIQRFRCRGIAKPEIALASGTERAARRQTNIAAIDDLLAEGK